MTKHTAIILLGFLVVVLPILGFPSWMRSAIIIVSGLGIVVLAYLSSVVYCSHCRKLIEDSDSVGSQ